MRILIVGLLLTSVTSWISLAQEAIPAAQRYNRAVCVVPLTGSGREIDDPIRPLLIPGKKRGNIKSADAVAPDQLIGYTWQESDDKKRAIVEYVVRTPAALAEIMKDGRAKCFERGKGSKSSVEAELRSVKGGFSLGNFGAIVR